MIPPITDTILTGAIATSRMAAAGHDYWHRGRVGQLDVDTGHAVVRAPVRGSAGAPYRVALRFRPGAMVNTTCTCPVGVGCKHAAAVLLALQARQNIEAGHGALAGRSVPTDAIFSKPEPPSPIIAPLPPSLSHWATAMKPLIERHGNAAPPASRAILYVVRVQALAGTTRLSKKRPLASLTLPGCALRLLVEAVDIAFDGDGCPVGNGAKAQPPGLYGGYAGPAYITDEDRLIMRRLQMRIGDTDHEGCLTGVGGADLFERILRTGRARWATARGGGAEYRHILRTVSRLSPNTLAASRRLWPPTNTNRLTAA